MGWHIVNSKEVAQWIADRTTGFYSDRSVALGLKKDDQIVGGVSYENWNGRSIFVNIALEDRMTPAFLAAIFDYPFNVCQVEKLIVSVSSGNKKSINLVKKMGFKEEARIKDVDPDGDFVFFTLPKDECRFLSNKYGRKIVRGPINRGESWHKPSPG